MSPIGCPFPQPRKAVSDMTVDEYRRKHPKCEYCNHRIHPFDHCIATGKRIRWRSAKKCPCYVAKKWEYNTEKEKKQSWEDILMLMR